MCACIFVTIRMLNSLFLLDHPRMPEDPNVVNNAIPAVAVNNAVDGGAGKLAAEICCTSNIQ